MEHGILALADACVPSLSGSTGEAAGLYGLMSAPSTSSPRDPTLKTSLDPITSHFPSIQAQEQVVLNIMFTCLLT